MTTISDQTKESIAKSEHTPTPWGLTENGRTIFAETGARLEHLDHPIPNIAYIARDSYGACFEEQEANAYFILRACNSFDTTLAALKAAKEKLSMFAQSNPNFEPTWRQVTDAIAAAEGKPMRPAATQFLILDVETAHRGDMLLWWKPNCAGYTTRIEEAGRYSAEQINGAPRYFNNGKKTLAIADDVVLARAVRIVPADGRGALAEMIQQTAARKPFTVHNPDASQNPGAVSEVSGRTANAAENAREGDSCGVTNTEQEDPERWDGQA